MITPHQTQYFAWQLTRRLSPEDGDQLVDSIMNVIGESDLNCH